MTIESGADFVRALRRAALLSRDEMSQLTRTADGADARTLAKVALHRNWLTVYQVNQILEGAVTALNVGPYLVLDQLGQGGLSSVYKARHREQGNVVALKVILPEVIAHTEGRRQFLLEMEAMARLEHVNIVQFCDADQLGETVYYAMEYVEGTDLGKYVDLSGPLPVAEACEYVRQTALGLQHAHERNLVHRDIKPVNLYLTAKSAQQTTGVVKILDWGLASLRTPRGVGGQEIVEHVATTIVGTADYLSPEQARNAHAVDIRGDVYSLGCTFHYLLTGQPPFPDGSLMQKILRHQSADPTPIAAFRADVPEGLAAVLRRMMEKDPAKRHQTPGAAAMALLRYCRRAASMGGTLQGRPSPGPVPRPIGLGDTPLPSGLASGAPTSRLSRTGKPRAEADTCAPR